MSYINKNEYLLEYLSIKKLLDNAPIPPPIGMHPTSKPSATDYFISILYFIIMV